MEPQNTRAGGCFMMGAILLGFLGGLAIRNPLLGVWVGTGLGLFIVAVLWMLDVRKP